MESVKPVKSKIVEKDVAEGAEWEVPAKRGVGCGMLFGLAFCVIPLVMLCFMVYGMFFGEVESWTGLLGSIVFVGVFIAVGGAIAYFGYRSRYTTHTVKVCDGGVDVVSKFSKREAAEAVAGGDVYGVGLYKSSETNNKPNYGLLVRAREGKDVKFGADLKEDELRWLASEMLWRLSEQGGLPAAEDMEEMYFSSVAGGKSEFTKDGVSVSADSGSGLLIEKDGSKTGKSMLFGGLFGMVFSSVFMGVSFYAEDVPLIFVIVGAVVAIISVVIFILGLTKLGTTERYTFESDRVLKEKLRRGVSLYKIRFPKKDFSRVEVRSSGSSNDQPRYSVVLKGKKEKLKLFGWVESEVSEAVKFKVNKWLEGENDNKSNAGGYGASMPSSGHIEDSGDDAVSRAPVEGFTAEEVRVYSTNTDLAEVKGGIWLVRGFLGVFLAVGLGLIFSGVSNMMTAKSSESWPSVQGVVLKSKVSVDNSGDGTTYGADVIYRYKVSGESYKGDKVTISEVSTSSRNRARKIVKRYRKGKKVTVYYDPGEPKTSVLERGLSGSSWFMPGLGSLFFLVPLGILIYVEKEYRKEEREEKKKKERHSGDFVKHRY